MLRAQWKERDRQLWARIDAVIKQEEERRRAEQEAERKKREEEERVKREAEEKKRLEDERKRKEEEERRKQKEKEEEEKRIKLAAAQAEKEREQAEAEARRALGHTTALEDWKRAREMLRVSSQLLTSVCEHNSNGLIDFEDRGHEDREGKQRDEVCLVCRSPCHHAQSWAAHQRYECDRPGGECDSLKISSCRNVPCSHTSSSTSSALHNLIPRRFTLRSCLRSRRRSSRKPKPR